MTRIGAVLLKNVPDNGNPVRFLQFVKEGGEEVLAEFLAKRSVFERLKDYPFVRRVGIRYERAA